MVLGLWFIRHKPCTYLASKLTLSPNRPKWDFLWHTSSRSSIGCVQIDFYVYGMFHANRASFIGSRIARPPNRPNQASTWAPLTRSTIGLSKVVSSPMVHEAQIVHLSCTETNTLSKETEARFYMTHVILEFHRVSPNWCLSIWCVPCKQCTYLASRLALSPNRPNWASISATSPRSTIGCVQNGFLAYGALGANNTPVLHRN